MTLRIPSPLRERVRMRVRANSRHKTTRLCPISPAQDDCKVPVNPLVVSLSNHRRIPIPRPSTSSGLTVWRPETTLQSSFPSLTEFASTPQSMPATSCSWTLFRHPSPLPDAHNSFGISNTIPAILSIDALCKRIYHDSKSNCWFYIGQSNISSEGGNNARW